MIQSKSAASNTHLKFQISDLRSGTSSGKELTESVILGLKVAEWLVRQGKSRGMPDLYCSPQSPILIECQNYAAKILLLLTLNMLTQDIGAAEDVSRKRTV